MWGTNATPLKSVSDRLHRLAAVLPVHSWTTGSLGCPKSTDSSSLWAPRFCACQSNQPKLCLSTFPKRDHWCFTPSHSSWLPSGTTYWSLSWQRTRKPLSFQWLRRNLLVFHGSVFFFLVSNMYIYVYTNKYVHIHVICAIAWVSQVKIHRTYRYIEHIIHIMYNTDTYMYTYWIDQDQDY